MERCGAPEGASAATSLPAVGDTLAGAYDLRGLLGRGGMAVVFEAHDRYLRRSVAIKYPTGPSEASRLVAEGAALAALVQPSLPAVHGVGWDGTVPFLVMERVHGLTLDEHLELRTELGQPFSIDEALEHLTRVATALRAIHEAGVAHLDVKPSNVILAPGRVVLVDLGLARPEFAVHELRGATGTPGYMAPEVIERRTAPGRGHRADMYSFGVLGYELLTLELPFESDDLAEVLERHVVEPAPDLVAARPDAPIALCALIDRLMEKQPEERPSSMEEVLFTLREIAAERAAGVAFRPIVLVADDDPAMRDLLASWIAAWLPGAEIHCAADGEEGLRLTGERAYDLAIIDLELPEVSGVEMLMYLFGSPRIARPEAIVVSARVNEPVEALLRRIGVEHVVSKGPGLEAELAERIRAVRGELPRRSQPPRPA